MSASRSPRDLLLAALARRQLTGFRASPRLAWVVFPPPHDGGTSVQVLHDSRRDRYRVVSSQTGGFFTDDVTTLGDFQDGDAAAACVAAALAGAPHDGAGTNRPSW